METLKPLLCYEGTATTTEQKIPFPVRKITDIKVTGTTNVAFSFDRSLTADDHPMGLKLTHALLKEARTDYIAHCADALSATAAYNLLVDLRTQYIAHCAMGEGTHVAADETNEDVAAIASSSVANMCTAANSLKAKYNAHDNDSSSFHTAAGTAIQVAATNATTLPTLVTLLNEIYDDLVAHMAATDIHTAADETNVVTAAKVTVTPHNGADATNNGVTALNATPDLTNMKAVANSLKTKYNAHDAEATAFHIAAGTAHQVSAADATTLPTLITLVNAIVTAYVAHMADAVAHITADTTHVITIAPAVIGERTVAKDEVVQPFELACKELYFKAASDTSTFKIYGLAANEFEVLNTPV